MRDLVFIYAITWNTFQRTNRLIEIKFQDIFIVHNSNRGKKRNGRVYHLKYYGKILLINVWIPVFNGNFRQRKRKYTRQKIRIKPNVYEIEFISWLWINETTREKESFFFYHDDCCCSVSKKGWFRSSLLALDVDSVKLVMSIITDEFCVESMSGVWLGSSRSGHDSLAVSLTFMRSFKAFKAFCLKWKFRSLVSYLYSSEIRIHVRGHKCQGIHFWWYVFMAMSSTFLLFRWTNLRLSASAASGPGIVIVRPDDEATLYFFTNGLHNFNWTNMPKIVLANILIIGAIGEGKKLKQWME